jgi:hypothetical protein
MTKTVVKLVALVAAGLLLLSGCGKDNPKVAATVGSVQFSAAEVDQLAAELSSEYPELPLSWRPVVADMLVSNELVTVAEQVTGSKPSVAARTAIITVRPVLSVLSNNTKTAKLANGYADYLLLRYEPKSLAVMVNNPVRLNPAYGVWNQAEAKSANETGSLSVSMQ